MALGTYPEMKLIFKRPDNKPPFVGLEFSSEFDAERTNKVAINNYNTHDYVLVLEPKGDTLDILLTTKEGIIRHWYRHVKYHPTQLHQFLASTKFTEKYNFSHIVTDNNKHKVVHSCACHRLWVLKVVIIKLLFEY